MVRLCMLSHAGIVGDKDDSDAVGAVELLEHLQEFLAGARVKVAGRLIGKEHLWVVDKRPGDSHPLLLAAGKLRRVVINAVCQTDFSSNSAARCFF